MRTSDEIRTANREYLQRKYNITHDDWALIDEALAHTSLATGYCMSDQELFNMIERLECGGTDATDASILKNLADRKISLELAEFKGLPKPQNRAERRALRFKTGYKR